MKTLYQPRIEVHVLRFVLFCATLFCCTSLRADEASSLRVETLLAELDNPCGIALQPDSADLYIAESGAGRILRVTPGEPAKVATVIEGFPREQFGNGPSYRIGPLALAFIDRSTLVVGEGGQAKGAEVVRVYSLPADGRPLELDQTKQVLGPLPAGNQSASGEGDFFAIAVTPTRLFVVGHGDKAKGWVLKADIANATAIQLAPFLATKPDTGVDAPTALAISKRGELVVGHSGKLDRQKDGLITFYDARAGKRLLTLQTELYDITALAYAPQSGLLYATDFAWSEPTSGGLYRLDMDIRDGRQAIKTVKVCPLNRPAGLAFASDRVIYVTTFGTGDSAAANDSRKTGQLLKVTGF